MSRRGLAVLGPGLLVAATVVLANLATDIVYMFVDPRIRFGNAE